jgi:hypothetical protein
MEIIFKFEYTIEKNIQNTKDLLQPVQSEI